MSLRVEIVHTFPTHPARVFDAWLDPVALSAFLTPDPGVRTEQVSVDPKVGGGFSLVMIAGSTEIPIHGSYLEIDRPHRLVFGWRSSRTTAQSVVTLTFEAVPEGTRLTLHHTGFPDSAARDDHDGGWAHILETLHRLMPHS